MSEPTRKCPNCDVELDEIDAKNSVRECSLCGFLTAPIEKNFNELYAWLSVDPDGQESIFALQRGGTPRIRCVVGPNRQIMERLGRYIERAAANTGRGARLVRFSKKKIITEINGQKK